MYFLFHKVMEFVQIKSMIVTYNGKESEKECACVCICMCTAESLCCISETSTTPKSTILQLKKKKTYEEKYRKTKKHNSSFYLSVITWNVNYSGWRKSFQVENSKGLNFLGQVNWKVNIKIKTQQRGKWLPRRWEKAVGETGTCCFALL